MKKFTLLFFTFVIAFISAQAQYLIKGNVTDSTGVSEPYATIRIYKQPQKEKALKIATTDIDGNFKQELSSSGKYTLQISSVGKIPINKDFELSLSNKTIDFGTLIIQNDANTLKGIEIVAQKPLVTTEIDRISYDIQADEESKTNNIFDMLKKVPMVTIDGEENIMVNGSKSFKIYKNGRPNTAWSNNPKDVLKSIPANMIKRIEVITEPGAKYDAEGVAGILNIIVNETSIINGVMGNVSAFANTNENYGVNTYLTSQIGKLTTSINYSYSNLGKANVPSYSTSEYIYTDSQNHLKSSIEGYKVRNGNFHYGNIESSYEIDTLNLITFSFGGYFYNVNHYNTSNTSMLDKNGNTIFSYTSISSYPQQQYFDFDGKLDYQHLTHNKGEALTFSYLLSTTNQEYISEISCDNMINYPLSYDKYNSNSKLHFYEHTFQFDWTRPFLQKHKVEMGLKYILRQNFSKTLYEYNNGQNSLTDFDHITNIGAVYGEYSFNSKIWGFRAGLRYELAHIKGKYKNSADPSFSSNIGDIVPTLSGSYKINDANTLKLNFATRINRPGISYLNPARNESPTLVSFGNPNLKSTRRNSLRLSYTLIKQKFTLSYSTDYSWANNMLMDYDYIENDIRYSTYINDAKNKKWSCSLYAQWAATKTTNITLNGSLGYLKFTYNENLKNSGWNNSCYLNISQELPYNLNLNGFLYHFKNGAESVYENGCSINTYGFSLSRSFLKDESLTVRINTSNPFSSKYITHKSYTIQGVRTGFTKSQFLTRNFGISVSYRFGKLNANVKKTNKTITNDDLEGRK